MPVQHFTTRKSLYRRDRVVGGDRVVKVAKVAKVAHHEENRGLEPQSLSSIIKSLAPVNIS